MIRDALRAVVILFVFLCLAAAFDDEQQRQIELEQSQYVAP